MFGFGWLYGRLFRRRERARAEAWRRGLFVYSDGTRDRFADPSEAWRSLGEAAGETWHELLAAVAAAPPADATADALAAIRKRQDEAAGRLADAASKAFDVRPYTSAGGTGGGLTVAERVALVGRFLAFMTDLAAAGVPTPVPTTQAPAATPTGER